MFKWIKVTNDVDFIKHDLMYAKYYIGCVLKQKGKNKVWHARFMNAGKEVKFPDFDTLAEAKKALIREAEVYVQFIGECSNFTRKDPEEYRKSIRLARLTLTKEQKEQFQKIVDAFPGLDMKEGNSKELAKAGIRCFVKYLSEKVVVEG